MQDDKQKARRWVAKVLARIGAAVFLASVAGIGHLAWDHGVHVALSVALTTLAYIGALTLVASTKAGSVKCDVCGNYYTPGGDRDDD